MVPKGPPFLQEEGEWAMEGRLKKKKASTALPEDAGSIPITHMAAYNYL